MSARELLGGVPRECDEGVSSDRTQTLGEQSGQSVPIAARIRVLNANARPATYRLSRGLCRIGAGEGVDILLDDGGHTNTQTWTTLVESLEHINDGGLLVIEDTHTAYKRSFGNPSSTSLLARLSAGVDELHYRSSEIDDLDRRLRRRDREKLLAGVDIAGRVHSIRFYESVVALSLRSVICVPMARATTGCRSTTPPSSSPDS